MAKINRWHLAAATAAPITVVLISLGLMALRGRAPEPAAPPEGGNVAGPEEDPVPEADLPRLAVTSEDFDAVGKLLDDLGEGYQYEKIEDEAIVDPKSRERFNAIFLTCTRRQMASRSRSSESRSGISCRGAGRSMPPTSALTPWPPRFPSSSTWPRSPRVRGRTSRPRWSPPSSASCSVPRSPSDFEQDGWRPAAFRGDDVDALVQGQLRTTAGVAIEAPLLVKFPFGKGTVLFTSFHSEKKNSETEIKLLNYLALKTVLARLESREVEHDGR